MSRLAIPAREQLPDAARPLLDAVEKLGSVPNLFRLLATQPGRTGGHLRQVRRRSRVRSMQTRERIALAVAAVNGCDYCMSAHTYLATQIWRSSARMRSRATAQGGSTDPNVDAAIRFAAKVARERGHVSDADIAGVRLAGYSDAQIVEIVAQAAENVFTNFLNEVAKTDIDFPVVRAAA
jgi:uncharacterized peroxidase-related enzyme